MAITELTDDLNIISALVDEPNDVGGLSAEQLKAKFDEAGNTIKRYINETLIPAAEAEITGKIAAAELQSGNIPAGGTAGQVLTKKSIADYDAKWATWVKGAEIFIGSYVGTGAYGSDSPTEIICEFDPDFLMILRADDDTVTNTNFFAALNVSELNETTLVHPVSSSSNAVLTYTPETKTLSLWNSKGAAAQLNLEGNFYTYLLAKAGG